MRVNLWIESSEQVNEINIVVIIWATEHFHIVSIFYMYLRIDIGMGTGKKKYVGMPSTNESFLEYCY